MSKYTITSEKLRMIEKSKVREDARAQGFYDGRFAPKVVKDKRKESTKYACRSYRYASTYREVDQLVDRVVWDHQAAGSSPVFPTNTSQIKV